MLNERYYYVISSVSENSFVWYTMLTANREVDSELIPLEYDYKRLAAEMKEEQIPQEFIDTILTGWGTTCLEILPAKERGRGRF